MSCISVSRPFARSSGRNWYQWDCLVPSSPRTDGPFPRLSSAMDRSHRHFSLKYLHLMEPFPEAAWRVCALTLSLASFFLLSQSRAVLSKARVYTERNHRFSWIFIFGSLLIFYELGQRRLYEAVKAIFLGFTAWIPHLLLIWQTLSNALEEKHWDLRNWAILLLPLYFLVTKIIDILYPLGCYLHHIAIPHADGNTINDFWSLFIRS